MRVSKKEAVENRAPRSSVRLFLNANEPLYILPRNPAPIVRMSLLLLIKKQRKTRMIAAGSRGKMSLARIQSSQAIK